MQSTHKHRGWLQSALAIGMVAMLASGCFHNSTDGARGPRGNPGAGGGGGGGGGGINTNLDRGDELPGVVLTVLSVSGGTRPDGNFQAGDRVTVNFTLETADGDPLPMDELDSFRMLVAGPTFNYQRVIDRVTNGVISGSAVQKADGSWLATHPTPFPATVPLQENETGTIVEAAGLSGSALLAGTYTVGIECYKFYWVDGVRVRDAENVDHDVLFGTATTLAPREVVKIENCNQCHSELQFHGSIRRDVKHCVLCHTSGAEDSTNGVLIDFRVMIHKIHNAKHLPSVLGVATLTDGSGLRDYTVPEVPYKVGRNDDFSHIGFPKWPNLNVGMPRDLEYPAAAGDRVKEDEILRGVTDCATCHGDPDGTGSLTAPAQGDLAYTQPNRRACGSCHDDVNWDENYVSNNKLMEAQNPFGDSKCIDCHKRNSGTGGAIEDSHVHPLMRPSFNPGVNFDLTAATPSAGPSLDPGETLALSFTIKNDVGTDIVPSTLNDINLVVSGPLSNRNLILSTSLPKEALVTGPNTINVPEPLGPELVAYAADDLVIETFPATMFTGHWNIGNKATSVWERTGTGILATTLTADAYTGSNFVDVLAVPADIKKGASVVLDDTFANEDYLVVAGVKGNRVWFTTPLRRDHLLGESILDVTLTKRNEGADWSLNAATGEITEAAVASFKAGNAVVCAYTIDWTLPAVFPMPENGSPDLDESWGKWEGLPIAPGTYRVGIWGRISKNFVEGGAVSTSYGLTSLSSFQDLLVAGATTKDPYTYLSSVENCSRCHNEPVFHGGGRRGVDTCLMCHSADGTEDRSMAKHGDPAAPDTPGVTISFRNMLHKIHMGKALDDPEAFEVLGYGFSPTWTSHKYVDVGFPAFPGEAANCFMCHGTGSGASANAWKAPADRTHPTAATRPAQVWRSVCTSCHDSTATAAHVELQTTTSGVESCAVCHGVGKEFNVELMHLPY